MKILHLVVDDKFIDSAIREFEAVAPGVHEYLILDACAPFRFITDGRVRTVTRSGWTDRVARPDVGAVVLHSLPPHHYPLLRDTPPGPVVIWLGWGFDYYGLLNDAFPDGLFLPATRHLVARLCPRTGGSGQMTASALSVGRPYPKPSASDRLALARVDHVSTLPQEYAMLRRHQPWFRAGLLEWNYLTMEDDLLAADAPPGRTGRDILIGNSATPSNNHLDLFAQLARRDDLSGRTLVVPLSYGDPAYADVVAKAGQDMFGPMFMPLRRYLPRREYLQVVGSCGTVVMNHVRQQAVGNLLIAGLAGARLFLNPANPARRWLQGHGVIVDDTSALHLRPLSPAERSINAAAIGAFTCRTARRRQTAALLDIAMRPAPAATPA